MKKILLLLLFVSASTNAQVVNIPDPYFKNYLVNYVSGLFILDANNDGEIQVAEAEALTHLEIDGHNNGNLIADITGIQAFTNLTQFDLWDHTVPLDINLSGLVNLVRTEIEANIFMPSATLNVQGCTSLENLQAYNSNITSVNISGCPNLDRVDLTSNLLETIDLTDSPLVTKLFIDDNPLLFLNIKNGVVSQLTSISIDSGGGNLFICADEGEEVFFEQAVQFYPNIFINSYCSFTPGGDYNTITGAVKFNSDNNGCTTGDPSILTKVHINDGTNTGYTFTNSEGRYTFYTQSGSFTVNPEFENDYFTVIPTTSPVNFPTVNNSVQEINFCAAPNGVYPDAEILIVPLNAAQPGFDALYKIVYKNKGNQLLTGNVILNYNDNVTDLVWASPVQSSSSTGQLVWNYTDLLPFESRSIVVKLNINSPQDVPPVIIDDILAFTASVTPATSDETPADNNFSFNHAVTGSFDPNDIICLEGAVVSPDVIGEYLHYNINFENTGNAAATFIVVENVIDETQYDISTLEVLDASHVVSITATDNKIVYRFDDINLGALEKGNIVFKIKTLNSLEVNDDVTQKANIFFDYNFPIATNEATTVFEAALRSNDFSFKNNLKIYPNPSSGIVHIIANTGIQSIELYDIQGRLLQAVMLNTTEATIDISKRASGIYFMKVKTEQGIKVEKLVRQ